MLDTHAEPEKRNCGRTGPTSAAGRAASSKNAILHGACARTLILPEESPEDWELLLSHWLKTYQPAEDSLEYDFVLKVAQAEWQRIRAHRNYDFFICSTGGFPSIKWSPDKIKQYDLAMRYKTAAERAFQREYRLLEQHYKIHRPARIAPADADASPSPSSPVINAENPPDRVAHAPKSGDGDVPQFPTPFIYQRPAPGP